jgi:hypothetical protein
MSSPFESLLQLQWKVTARIQPAKTHIVCPCPCPSVSSTCTTVTQVPAGDRAQYGSEKYRLLTSCRPVSKQGCAKCRMFRCVLLLCPARAETDGWSKIGTCERSATCLRRFHSKHLYIANNHIALGLSRLV